mmetsp:Transcript_31249/g.76072  ORF Transcript_31249/g.76072 Transcript_31249/m.76072 type:complete len:222 (+) Transcript_31249:159-824(+)
MQISHTCWLDEHLIRLVWHLLPGLGQIDHPVHHDVEDVDPLGPQVAGQRLGQAALGGFGRGEPRGKGHPAPVRGGSRDPDGSRPPFRPHRPHLLGHREQTLCVHVKSILELLGGDLVIGLPRPRPRVEYDDVGLPHLLPHRRKSCLHRVRLRDIALEGLRSGDLTRHRLQLLHGAGEQSDFVALGGEFACGVLPDPRANPNDNTDLRHGNLGVGGLKCSVL